MIKSNFHINLFELKIKIIYFFLNFFLFFIISFVYKTELLFLFSYLFLQHETGFIYTNLFEPLFVYLKLSFSVSLVLSFPSLVYFLFFFFFKSFQNFYLFFLFCYLLLFYLLFCVIFIFEFFYIFPLVFDFLLSFQQFNLFNLILTITLQEYVSFFINIFFIYLFLALVPSVFCLCVIINFFESSLFFNYKLRIVLYFVILIIFLILAPPDFILQCLIAPSFMLILEIFVYFNICFLKILELYKNFHLQHNRIK